MQMVLSGLNFLLGVGSVLPHDRGVAADFREVHHVAIQDNGARLKHLGRLLEGF